MHQLDSTHYSVDRVIADLRPVPGLTEVFHAEAQYGDRTVAHVYVEREAFGRPLQESGCQWHGLVFTEPPKREPGYIPRIIMGARDVRRVVLELLRPGDSPPPLTTVRELHAQIDPSARVPKLLQLDCLRYKRAAHFAARLMQPLLLHDLPRPWGGFTHQDNITFCGRLGTHFLALAYTEHEAQSVAGMVPQIATFGSHAHDGPQPAVAAAMAHVFGRVSVHAPDDDLCAALTQHLLREYVELIGVFGDELVLPVTRGVYTGWYLHVFPSQPTNGPRRWCLQLKVDGYGLPLYEVFGADGPNGSKDLFEQSIPGLVEWLLTYFPRDLPRPAAAPQVESQPAQSESPTQD